MCADIAPLPKIMELKEKYCFRIIMDDSYGIGVLGKSGRGTCEHYGIPVWGFDLNLSSFLALSVLTLLQCRPPLLRSSRAISAIPLPLWVASVYLQLPMFITRYEKYLFFFLFLLLIIILIIFLTLVVAPQ